MRVTHGNLTFGVEDGWHSFDISNLDFLKSDTGDITTTLRIPCQVADGDQDSGQQVSMFCDLKERWGKFRLAQVLYYSGLAKKLSKEKDMPEIDSEEGWPDKIFEADHKMIKTIMSRLPGEQIKGYVVTQKFKDRKGEEKTGQNMTKLDFINSTGSATKPATTANPPTQSAGEDDAW